MNFEVVEYRKCSGGCGVEDCQEDHETVLFEHTSKEQCINFMLRFPDEKGLLYHATKHYENDNCKMDIVGILTNGRKWIRKLRVQESMGVLE